METRGEVDRSFERLYRLHSREVYGAALRELGNVQDAEDVTQAAFVDAYRAILRGSRPESPRAWLLAIAENVRRRRFRTARRRPAEQPVTADAPAPELPHEQAQLLRAALESLPPLQREVFLLREIRGLSYEEIAARADSSVGAVQMLLFRARQALRAELDPPSTAARARARAWPFWLLQLAGRADRSFLAPRGAGAVGAAALVLGAAAGGPVEARGDAAGRTPTQSHHAPVARDEARAAPVAERRLVAQPAGATTASRRPTERDDPVSAQVAAVPAAPAGESVAAESEPPAAATAPTEAELEAPPGKTRESALPPLAEPELATPLPPEVPLGASNLPLPPPIEPPLPPVEVPPVELPPLPPVEPPLVPPPAAPVVPRP